MSHSLDPVRLSKTMSFLLRHRPDAADLTLSPEGWVEIEALVVGVTKLMRCSVEVCDVLELIEDSDVIRFELDPKQGIRAVADRRRRRASTIPDILYHAVSPITLDAAKRTGFLSAPKNRPLFLSTDESEAWRVAHRSHLKPTVLHVDSTRARRHGVKFRKSRKAGMYSADRIPVADVLNLQEHFGMQLSSGGIPVVVGKDGVPRMALIQVTRRSGVTWEVAKGKLEVGETPESAGIREVREEMGIESELRVTDYVGLIRYGFLAPGGLPRLKSVYLFLMEPVDSVPISFTPRLEEGIDEVRWFTAEEACRAVTHSSLRQIMRRAQELALKRYGVPASNT